MTKTEIALLDRGSRNGIVTVMTGYYTGRRPGWTKGNINANRFGTREHAAAIKLVNAGRLRFLHNHSSVDGNMHATEHVFEMIK